MASALRAPSRAPFDASFATLFATSLASMVTPLTMPLTASLNTDPLPPGEVPTPTYSLRSSRLRERYSFFSEKKDSNSGAKLLLQLGQFVSAKAQQRQLLIAYLDGADRDEDKRRNKKTNGNKNFEPMLTVGVRKTEWASFFQFRTVLFSRTKEKYFFFHFFMYTIFSAVSFFSFGKRAVGKNVGIIHILLFSRETGAHVLYTVFLAVSFTFVPPGPRFRPGIRILFSLFLIRSDRFSSSSFC